MDERCERCERVLFAGRIESLFVQRHCVDCRWTFVPTRFRAIEAARAGGRARAVHSCRRELNDRGTET